MFESRERLVDDIGGLLEGLRRACDARYACLLTPERLVFEREEPEADVAGLRRRLRERAGAVFALPGALEGAGPDDDVFDGFEADGFLLTVINSRVALVIVCPDPEVARARIDRALETLVDRLLRYEPRWRLDAQGRGLFLGRPRLDTVVIGPA